MGAATAVVPAGCREEVCQSKRLCDPSFFAAEGVFDYQGNFNRIFVQRGSVSIITMLSEKLTMVGSDDYQ